LELPVVHPKKQKVRFRKGLNQTQNLSVVPSCGHSSEEFTMKRILVALVLALTVVSGIGCSGGSSTSKPASGK
jgi:hypothetical protein